MIDKEKLEKLKKLADAMYYAAQYLTTDASRLHKAMDEYHKFIIHEYKKEPKECIFSKDNYTDEDRKVLCDGCEEECIENINDERKRDLSLWSLGDFENNFLEIIKPYKDSRNYKNLCIRLVVWRSELWRWIHWKKRKEEPVSEDKMTISKEWFEHCKKSWYNEGYIDGEYNRDRQFKEPVSKDLEAEIKKAFLNNECSVTDAVSLSAFTRIARHFANWQKQQLVK